MIKMNIRCRLFGHKIDHDFTDGGYHVCERCQMHEYWQSFNFMAEHEIDFKHSFHDDALLLRPYFYIMRRWWFLKRRIAFECRHIGSKIEKIFSTIDNDELPF